jgi:hypothetical protein
MFKQVWQKKISFLFVWVFLVNALLPSLVQASVHSLSQTSAQSESSTKILICTAQGYKWVDISELENTDQSEQPKQHFECPLCYSALQPLAVPQPDAEIRLPLPSHVHKVNYRLELKSRQKQNHFLLTTSKRGPPSFA